MAQATHDHETNSGSATYTISEMAVILKCSQRHIHRLKGARQIPGLLPVGRLVRFSKPIVDEWLLHSK